MWHCHEQKLPFDSRVLPRPFPREIVGSSWPIYNAQTFQGSRITGRTIPYTAGTEHGNTYERPLRLQGHTLSDWLSPRCGPSSREAGPRGPPGESCPRGEHCSVLGGTPSIIISPATTHRRSLPKMEISPVGFGPIPETWQLSRGSIPGSPAGVSSAIQQSALTAIRHASLLEIFAG
jgi:hypothetical protein